MKLICGLIFALALAVDAADFDLAAHATNQLGVDLHRQLATGDENLCLSPYSIETALAMTFDGADGETRSEMARVLHFPNDGDAIHASFAALQSSLDEMSAKTAKIAEQSTKHSGPSEPITLSIGNRLFGQNDYEFRDAFQQLMKEFYGAPLEMVNFQRESGCGAGIHQQLGGQANARQDPRLNSDARHQ
jgi:serpin B